MQDLNANLINAMKQSLPENANLLNVIIDVLSLGKEASYRRLRGEVSFSFSEIVAICLKLNISIDMIIGNLHDQNAMFNFNTLKHQSPFSSYHSLIDSYIDLFSKMVDEVDTEICITSNIIPQLLYLKYPNLSKFRFFKWVHHYDNTLSFKQYDEVEITSDLIYKQQKIADLSQMFSISTYIIDREMFKRFIDEIMFFHELGFISEDNLRAFKEELLQLINELESLAATGKNETGNEVKLYISDISFESNYGYIESSDYHQSMLEIFSINSLATEDDAFFNDMKILFQSLKKYSILITQSSELQRKQFFNQQINTINKVLL